MIEDSYVSYEVLSLLDKKGFGGYYEDKGGPLPQSIAQRWLREMWGYHIKTNPEYKNNGKLAGWKWYIIYLPNGKLNNWSNGLTNSLIYPSYEEALEDAIKYILENGQIQLINAKIKDD